MRKFFTKAVTALALVGTVTAVAAPAQAQHWGGYHGGFGRGYYGYHHGGGGTAVVAGLLGVGVGAAIASRPRYYGPGPGYGYGYGYGYAPPPAYYAPVCHRELRWDGWAGTYVPVRACY